MVGMRDWVPGVALVLAAAGAGAAEIHVAVDGEAGAAGTVEAAVGSVAEAVARAGAGDTVIVHGGTYAVRGRLRWRQSGEEGRPIRVWAAEGETPVLSFEGGDRGGIFIHGAWWHVRGLTVEKAEHLGIALFDEGAHHNRLEGGDGAGEREHGHPHRRGGGA